jgi:nicotinate-nucleotide--dimethylbenzimidazole phosphoribosyltransferase
MICAALYGGPAQDWLRPDPSGESVRADLIEQALSRHAGNLGDPLRILQTFGGRDIAAMAGAILAARLQRIPIVLDDVASASAAAVLHAVDPEATAHCLAGHAQPGGAHARILERIGAPPLLTLDIGGGEGIGAALAVGVLKAAAACCREPQPATSGGAGQPSMLPTDQAA